MVAIWLFFACAPDALFDQEGACELQYSQLPDYSEPVTFCVHESLSVCEWVHSSHQVSELQFYMHESCDEAGYTVCCETGTGDSWFADYAEADAAREYIEGVPCVPCT